MDNMIQSYMEETEDMIQKAEECIIRLEREYSDVDVNELFRIAHTIKGSSHMVGYEDIGNLMHRIEDMLDCARNGSILFDQSVVSLSFDGLDNVKKMLRFKVEPCPTEMMEELIRDASKISDRVEGFIKANKKEQKKENIKKPETGIVSTLLNKEPKGKYKYYITFIIEEDVPMMSPILMIILKSIEELGTLVYSSVTDDYFSGTTNDNEMRTFDVILCTDIDAAQLYTYFSIFYVEKINIINLSRSIHAVNDYCFEETDYVPHVIIIKVIMKLYKIVFNRPAAYKMNKEERYNVKNLQCVAIDALDRMQNENKEKINEYKEEFNKLFNIILKIQNEKIKTEEKFWVNSQGQMIRLIDKLYNETKGKYIVQIIKSPKDNFIDNLKNFIGMVNKSRTLIILIDISKLNIIHEHEIRDLIKIKKELQDQGIEISLIVEGTGARRIINIFDSIQQVDNFNVFASEVEAILGMFRADDSFNRIMKRIRNVEHEE